jgi:ATP-dependent RNA helicase DDX10/DBP4
MGFSTSVNAILRFLPKTGRQTFLFSATQTKSVRDLARLSLKHPEYISVHAEASAATPLKLHQSAIMCPLEEKLDMLWSFIKTHLNTKTIVFLSTCKQVCSLLRFPWDFWPCVEDSSEAALSRD